MNPIAPTPHFGQKQIPGRDPWKDRSPKEKLIGRGARLGSALTGMTLAQQVGFGPGGTLGGTILGWIVGGETYENIRFIRRGGFYQDEYDTEKQRIPATAQNIQGFLLEALEVDSAQELRKLGLRKIGPYEPGAQSAYFQNLMAVEWQHNKTRNLPEDFRQRLRMFAARCDKDIILVTATGK